MANYQYRIGTEGNWMSTYGFALLAIVNKSGSGKKISLKSLEIQQNTISAPTAAKASNAGAGLYVSQPSTGGENMSACYTAFDSSNILPSTVIVKRGSEPSGSLQLLRKYTISRFGAAAGTQNTLNTHKNFGIIGKQKSVGGGIYNSVSGLTVEAITINSGTCVSLIPQNIGASSPIRVSATLSVDNKSYIWEYFDNVLPDSPIISIENASGSTNVVKLLRLSISEVGTTDTPYIRLVPIGQINPSFVGDNFRKNINITPMDSLYPSASTWMDIYSDMQFTGLGVPDSYLTDTTAGIPRGFNYLQTKDFNGPNYRCYFPEFAGLKPGATSDNMGFSYSRKTNDIGLANGTSGSEIILNQGEGIALVSSCETAAAGQPSPSGWQSLYFHANLSVENAYTPYLTLTGLKTNTEIRIYSAGTYTELAGDEAITGGTFSWQYDYELYSNIDIVIHSLGYVYQKLESIALTNQGATIPITQIVDRVYSNP